MDRMITEMINSDFDLRITSEGIENQIKPYSLYFPKTLDYDIEWSTNLPQFAPMFYDYAYKYNHIPSQNCFVTRYLTTYEKDERIKALTTVKKEALLARLFRAYPSYVRDAHFTKILKESGKFDKVTYNIALDIKHGIDVAIQYNDKIYAVNLFTNTERANSARPKKADRHTVIEGIEYIDMPLTFSDGKKCGEFYLYTGEHANILYDVIRGLDGIH